MVRAKVTVPFPGRPDDETQVRQIEAGEIITGDLAAVALQQGWAEPDVSSSQEPTSLAPKPSKPKRAARAKRR